MNWFILSIFQIIYSSLVFGSSINQLHLLPLRKYSGGFSKIVEYAFSPTSIHPICFNFQRFNSFDSDKISHQLCKKLGFATFLKSELVNRKLFSVHSDDVLSWGTQTQGNTSTVSTDGTDDFQSINITEPDAKSCTHFWQVECGECHFSLTVSDSNSFTIRSPLYPKLPDQLICKYDVFSNNKIELLIENLDLQPAVTVSSGTRQSSHCLNSFLQIQPVQPPGFAGHQTTSSVYTFCGQVQNLTISAKAKHIRLLLVSGLKNEDHFKGFQIKFVAGKSSLKVTEVIIVSMGIVIPILCFIIIFFSHKLNCKKWKKSGGRRNLHEMAMRQRRQHRHSTWVGDLPRNGETIHETRTRTLQRLLESEENNYVMDNRVTRTSPAQRPLPQIPEENYPDPLYSIDGNNNVDLNVSLEEQSNSSRIYQTLQVAEKSKDQPLYLTLLYTGEKHLTDARNTLDSDDLSPILSNKQDTFGEKQDVNVNGILAIERMSTSTRYQSDSDMNKYLDDKTNGLLANGLNGIAALSRKLSRLGSRLASMASYTSIKRKETNTLEESLQLLESGDHDDLDDSPDGRDGGEICQVRDEDPIEEQDEFVDDVFQDNDSFQLK